MNTTKGTCRHGEFILTEGCPLCTAEYAQANSPANIAKRVAETKDRHRFSAPEPLSDEARRILTGGRDKMIADATSPSAPETTLVKVNPEQDSQVLLFLAESNKLLDYAEARVIARVEDLTLATNDLSIIAKIKKAMEEKRKDYLKPLQDHVKAVNETFKTLMTPIEDADRITRDKIRAFQIEQTRIRQEQEEINRLRLEASQKEAVLHNGEITEPVNLVEVSASPPKRVSTDMGSIGQRDNWKWELVDFALVPDTYKMINAGVLTPIVKASKGKVPIPGIRQYNEPILAVNTK